MLWSQISKIFPTLCGLKMMIVAYRRLTMYTVKDEVKEETESSELGGPKKLLNTSYEDKVILAVQSSTYLQLMKMTRFPQLIKIQN